MKTQRIVEIVEVGRRGHRHRRQRLGAHQARKQERGVHRPERRVVRRRIYRWWSIWRRFDEEELKPVTTGACIRVDGRLVASPRRGAGRRGAGRKARDLRHGRSRDLSPAERRDIRWSSCATSPTCVRAPTRSARCSASVTPWPMPSTSISTTTVSTISILRSSRLRTARAPVRCSR